MRYVLLIILVFTSSLSFASIDFNNNCRKAYREMIQLEFQKSYKILEKEKSINPNNTIPSFIRNFAVFLRIIIEEDADNYDKFIEDTKIIVDAFEEESDKSPYKKYCITDLYLQMAYVNALQESYFSAALKLRSARSVIVENQNNFPDFIPNKKAIGIMNVAIGSVPENYEWIMDLFGLKGSVNNGLSMLKSLITQVKDSKSYSWLSTEAILSYTFSSINFGDSKKQDDFLQSIFHHKRRDSSVFNNQLLCYSAASYYHHNGDNESVIDVLSKRVAGKSTQKMYYLDFVLGSAFLYKIDPRSIKYLKLYLTNFKGKAYRKTALQKIAWYNLVLGNVGTYKQYIKRVKMEGNAFFDGDKQAMKEAESGEVPNKYLLKFRLLFDGGYYREAKRVFETNAAISVLKTKKDFLEYNYRLGRLYDEWGKTTAAIGYYNKAIQEGKDYPYYYAANASLHMGYIYEKQGNSQLASKYYRLCLSLDFNEYHNSITQKAKAGLNRVTK